jgi:hypothetical protein
MDASCRPLDGLGTSREEIALSGIVDVLSWRHVFEKAEDQSLPRPVQRVIVYPKFLEKLDAVLSSGDISADSEYCRAPAYEAILLQSMSWPVDRHPILLPERDARLSHWPDLVANAAKWMQDAKRTAIGNCRQVLEDGPDKCDSESDNEYRDDGDNY